MVPETQQRVMAQGRRDMLQRALVLWAVASEVLPQP